MPDLLSRFRFQYPGLVILVIVESELWASYPAELFSPYACCADDIQVVKLDSGANDVHVGDTVTHDYVSRFHRRLYMARGICTHLP